jgi:hypothetical protein
MRTTRFSSFTLPISLIAAASLGLVGCDLIPADAALPEAPEDDFLNDDEGSLADFLADADGDSFTPDEGDCDDANANRFPGNIEICDGQDNNCDGAVDNSPGCMGDDDDAADADDPRAGTDQDEDEDQASVAIGARFAVLVNDDDGTYDIQILEAGGELVQHIDANVWGAQYLDYHRDGFFLVSGNNEIYRVETDGTTSVLFSGCSTDGSDCLGIIYQIDELLDGNILVAAEDRVVEIDLAGNIVNTANGLCFMDVIAQPEDQNAAVVLDIMQMAVVLWSGADEAPETLFEFSLSQHSLGQDLSGGLWMGGWNDAVTRYQDGSQVVVGNLSDMLPGASELVSIAAADESSVFSLLQRDEGSVIARINVDGNAEVVLDAGWDLWIDMVVL